MQPWNPSELSAGGARGMFWCFTELPRVGERICRKTVDGTQTWAGKSGRNHKNGFPDEIMVAKYVLKDAGYHMLELTLKQDMHTVALCKIWRTGTTAVESPQSMNQGTSPSNQVEDNHEATGMQIIDQSQEHQLHMSNNHAISLSDCTMSPNNENWGINLITGQFKGNEHQPNIPGHALPTSDYIVNPYSTGGQLEGIEQERHMSDQVASYMVNQNSMGGQLGVVEEQAKRSEDALLVSDYVVLPTDDIIQSGGQDDDSIYQGAVSYLYGERDSFRYIVLHGRNEAHEIALTAQRLASAMRNLLNRFTSLGINSEPGNTRTASTTINNQIRTITDGVTEQDMQATEPTTEDGFLEQETAQQIEDYMEDEYFMVDDFINLRGPNERIDQW